MKFQIGKSGVNEGVLESLRLGFKTHKVIRISVLKNFAPTKEKVKEVANLVWQDQIWKEQMCMGLGVKVDELQKWLAMFNSSIASDKIANFDKSSYKKMSRGWIQKQKQKGTVVETGLAKTSTAPTLTRL